MANEKQVLGEVAKNTDDVSTETKLLENKNKLAGLLEDKTASTTSTKVATNGGKKADEADYFVDSKGEIGTKENLKWLGKSLVREEMLEGVENQALRNTINEMYRGSSKFGDGGIIDAILYEKESGKLIQDKSHFKKGVERARNLENILRRQNLNEADRAKATKLLNDLKNALER